MGNAIEDMMWVGLLSMTGNNAMFLGFALFAFFAALVFVLPVRGDVKVMVLVPAAMIAGSVVGVLMPILFLIGLAIIAFAALKIMNH